MTHPLKILTDRLKIRKKGEGKCVSTFDLAWVDAEEAGEGPAEMGLAFKTGQGSYFRHIHIGGGQVFFGFVQPERLEVCGYCFVGKGFEFAVQLCAAHRYLMTQFFNTELFLFDISQHEFTNLLDE